ncbi:MAG: hypothetical protein ABIN97_15960 [Ginsengibacter sp.]
MMPPEKKMRSFVFIIGFLVITNIALLLFLIFSGDKPHRSQTHDVRSVIESFLEDQIGFDKKQMAVYKEMRKSDFEKRVPIFDTLKSEKNKFYENIYNDSIPDSVINKWAVVVSEKQMAVDTHMLQYFKKVRHICTTEQLPKFDSSFKVIVERITSVRFKKSNNH